MLLMLRIVKWWNTSVINNNSNSFSNVQISVLIATPSCTAVWTNEWKMAAVFFFASCWWVYCSYDLTLDDIYITSDLRYIMLLCRYRCTVCWAECFSTIVLDHWLCYLLWLVGCRILLLQLCAGKLKMHAIQMNGCMNVSFFRVLILITCYTVFVMLCILMSSTVHLPLSSFKCTHLICTNVQNSIRTDKKRY